MRLAELLQLPPQRRAVACGHGNLEAGLAGETDPRDARRHAADATLGDGHVRQRGGREIDAGLETLDHGARVRPADRDGRPCAADIDDADAQVRVLALAPFLQQRGHGSGVAARRREQEPVLGQPRDDTVIEHLAVLGEQQAVAHPSDRQVGERVQVHQVEEGAGVGARDLDLAERRGIEQPGALAQGTHLARDGVGLALVATREAGRAQPAAVLVEAGTEADLLGVQRRVSQRRVQGAAPLAGEGAERHRRVGRPERGGADRRQVAAGVGGEQRKTVDVAGAALVGRHAERGVAFQMLDRDIVLARRQRDVVGADIVHAVDPLARTGRAAHPAGFDAVTVVAARAWRFWHGAPRAERTARGDTGGVSVGKRRGGGEAAGRGAAGRDRLRAALGHEGAQHVVVAQSATGLRIEVHGRVPATGNGQQIAFDECIARGHGAPAAIRDPHAAHATWPERAGRQRARAHAQPARLRLLEQVPGWRVTAVEHAHLGAVRVQIEGGRPCAVVVGADHHAAAGAHGITAQVLADGGRGHDPGQVVVREHQRALDGTARQHDPARAQFPQPVRRDTGACRGAALEQGDVAMVETGEGGGACHQPRRRGRGQCGERACRPVECRLVVDEGVGFAQQRTAGLVLLVDQQHAQSRRGGGARGGETRRAGADHQHVAVRVQHGGRLVGREILHPAEPGETPHQPFPELPAGLHEGLVVEARGQEAVQQIHAGEQVQRQCRPGVHGACAHARREFHAGGTGVRVVPFAVPQVDDGIRFFGAGAPQAARAVVLEAPREHTHVVGEQCRGERVAGMAVQTPRAEAELDGPLPVDAPAAGETVRLRIMTAGVVHRAPPPLSGGASPMR